MLEAAPPSIWRLVSKRAGPIVVLNGGASDVHLYCVHSVTGDVGGLQLFASFFGPRRVHGIQVSKGEMNGQFAESIELIARHHVKGLTAFQPDGPIHLLGWSAGAIIALEMAQQLRRLGRDVPLLIALDGAPCNTGAGLPRWHPLYIAKLLANVPRWLRDDRESDWSFRGVRRRLDEKLAFKFGIGTRALSGGQTLDAATMNALLDKDGWSADQKSFGHAIHKAMIAYVPQPYPDRVLVFETQTQPLHHLRQIGAAWRKICEDPEIVRLKGNHSSLIKGTTAEAIARRVLQHLRERDDAPSEPLRRQASAAVG